MSDRRVILKMVMSLNGFVTSPDGTHEWMFEWFGEDSGEWNRRALEDAGVHAMGRRSYEIMGPHWAASEGPIATAMNEKPKAVFSHTLENAEWEPVEIFGGDLGAEIADLKGRDDEGTVLVHGGPGFAKSLTRLGLVNEYQLTTVPIAIGAGRSPFAELEEHLKLDVVEEQRFSNGALARSWSRSDKSRWRGHRPRATGPPLSSERMQLDQVSRAGLATDPPCERGASVLLLLGVGSLLLPAARQDSSRRTPATAAKSVVVVGASSVYRTSPGKSQDRCAVHSAAPRPRGPRAGPSAPTSRRPVPLIRAKRLSCDATPCGDGGVARHVRQRACLRSRSGVHHALRGASLPPWVRQRTERRRRLPLEERSPRGDPGVCPNPDERKVRPGGRGQRPAGVGRVRSAVVAYVERVWLC